MRHVALTLKPSHGTGGSDMGIIIIHNIKRNMSRQRFIDRNTNEKSRKAQGSRVRFARTAISIIIIYTCAINSGGL